MNNLRQSLRSIDHKGYPAYKSLKGVYQFDAFLLHIEKVQGDPFASPSRVSVQVKGNVAKLPKECYENKHRRIAVQDFLLRSFGSEINKYSFKAKGSGKSGLISVSRPGQEIIERTACRIDAKTGEIFLRMSVGFPANGRSINARELEKVLFDYIPACVEKTLLWDALNQKGLRKAWELADDQKEIRKQMKQQDLIAFVANDSILPRESGVSSRPMKEAVPFQSPESMEVTMELPHKGTITGMGIKKGVTLIVGGGYHGKSTLLQTLEKCVYSHIAGDGREYVAMEPSAMKIRSEDGRSIKNKDISMFIRNLPGGKDTRRFSTPDASGSTSQAANVAEAIEAESETLLIDEDTSATNFMIRDELMEKVVAAGQEPIVPFIKLVRSLFLQKGISTILVAGSCGAFFHVADKIIQMDHYQPKDVTEFAKEQGKAYPLGFDSEERVDIPETFDYAGSIFIKADRKRPDRDPKVKTMGTDGFMINKESTDMRYMEQIVDSEQMLAIAQLVLTIAREKEDRATAQESVIKKVKAIEDRLEKEGFQAVLGGACIQDMAMPRRQEIFGAINRMR